MLVVKESNVTERMIHTGGEQIQGNETRNFRHPGAENRREKGGGVGKLDSTSSLAWTRTHEEPGKSETCGYSRTAPARIWTVGAKASVACSMPASVYSRVARKRKFSTLSLRSAVENGSFALV